MLVALFWFVTLDATAKFLMQSYSLVQVVWARFFIHVLLAMLLMGRRLKEHITSRKPAYQLLRSFLLLLMTALWFLGLKTIPMATASTILFMAPIIVTILAWPVLGDFVGPKRWGGVVIGFIGAMVVIRPDISGVQIGMLAALGAAISNGVYQVLTRKVRTLDSPLTSLFYTGFLGAAVLSFAVPFHWTTPTVADSLLFLYAGFSGAISHLCLIRAFQLAPAPVLAPFSYTSLIWASAIGYLVFGDVPDQWTLIGAGLIIGSGLYIFYRERRLRHLS